MQGLSMESACISFSHLCGYIPQSLSDCARYQAYLCLYAPSIYSFLVTRPIPNHAHHPVHLAAAGREVKWLVRYKETRLAPFPPAAMFADPYGIGTQHGARARLR